MNGALTRCHGWPLPAEEAWEAYADWQDAQDEAASMARLAVLELESRPLASRPGDL